MSNKTLIASDHQSMTLINSQANNKRLSIGRRGVLLSVLGTDICGTEVSSSLDEQIKTSLRGKKPFYEYSVGDETKNQLCLTYNEGSNTLFVIGITDVIIGFAVPEELNAEKVKTFGIRLKKSAGDGLISNQIILARLEGKMGSLKKIAFYHIQQSADS